MINHKITILKLLISHFTFPQYSYYLYWNYLYELYNLYLLETSLEMDGNIEYPDLEGTHKNQCLTPDSTQGNLGVKPHISEHGPNASWTGFGQQPLLRGACLSAWPPS